VAEIVTGVLTETMDVEILKFAVVAPDSTVTVAGTTAAGSLLLRFTTRPPLGAA